MKILFKNTTKYSKEIYNAFQSFHSQKYSFSYNLYTLSIIFLILFCIIINVTYNNYTSSIFFCCIFTFFILWRFFHPIFTVKKELESEKIAKEKCFSFIFYNNKFKVKDKTAYDIIRYSKIRKAFETDNFFYLYVDRTHAFILDKNCFSIGNTKDFSSFLKEKLKFRFKVIKIK